MAEDFLSSIADELRAQQSGEPKTETLSPSEVAPVNEEQPAETAIENNNPQVETNVENQEPTEEKAWWEQEETNQPIEQNLKETTESKPSEIELDNDVKLLLEYKKSGKTLADFVKEYEINDFKDWNDEKYVEEGMKEFMNLNQEELEQAIYEFKNASVFQKKQWADSFKEKFELKNQDKLKQLTGTQKQAQEKAEVIANQYRTELQAYSDSIKNKEIYGLKITDEMSNNLKDYIDKEFRLSKEDGTVDVQKMYDIALWLKYGQDMVKANVTKARNEGKEQVIREVTNPSKNYTNVGKNVGSGLEAVQEAFATMFPG